MVGQVLVEVAWICLIALQHQLTAVACLWIATASKIPPWFAHLKRGHTKVNRSAPAANQVNERPVSGTFQFYLNVGYVGRIW